MINYTKCPICGKKAEAQSRFHLTSGEIVRLTCGCLVAGALNLTGKFTCQIADMKSMSGKTLYPFQVEGVKKLAAAGFRAGLFDEQGLGKTVQACIALRANPDLMPCLIICKANLVTQIFRMVVDWTRIVPNVVGNKIQDFYPEFRIHIISMDTLWRMNPEKVEKFASSLQTLIVDECQYMKNSGAKRTVALKNLGKAAKFFIPMSGTPIENNAGEYFNVLNLIRPDLFPTETSYLINHCLYSVHSHGSKVLGLANPAKFKEETKDFIIRRMTRDVLPDLPPISRMFSYTALDESVEELYEKTMRDFLDFSDDRNLLGKEKFSFQEYSNLLEYINKMRHLTGLSKVEDAVDWTVDFLSSTQRKLVLFCHHQDVAAALKLKLEEQNVRLISVYGISAENRQPKIDRFISNPEVQVLIASSLASGEGVDGLQTVCYDLLIVERQWNASKEEQVEKRISRIGAMAQHANVTYLCAVGTIDEWFSELVERKRAMVRETMEGVRVDYNEESVIQELAQLLMTKGRKKFSLPK